MSLKAYNIDVPITPGVMPPVIHIGQYDSGRDYICHLKNDDGTDYTIPSGTTATFTGCNPRKEVFELEATVDTSANTVTITPKDEATSMFGKYGATLNLTLNDEQMSPIVILMDVQKAGATDEEIAGAANFPDAVTEAVNDWLEENIDEGQLGSLYVPQAAQAAKTTEMTQPVGIDGNGKLWTTPGEGGGSTEGAVLYNQSQSLTSGERTTARQNIGAGTYSKPSGGIPYTDIAYAVQASLDKADGSIQKAAQATKTVNDTVPVAIDSNGKLWVEPTGGGDTPVVVENTQLITMSYYDGDIYASQNAAQIYNTLDGGNANLVLIDRSGRECYLVHKPEDDSGDTCVAKFATFDVSGEDIIVYSISANGIVTSETVSVDELPVIGNGDDGKVLTVVSGLVAWAAIPETTTSEIDAIIAAI